MDSCFAEAWNPQNETPCPADAHTKRPASTQWSSAAKIITLPSSPSSVYIKQTNAENEMAISNLRQPQEIGSRILHAKTRPPLPPRSHDALEARQRNHSNDKAANSGGDQNKEGGAHDRTVRGEDVELRSLLGGVEGALFQLQHAHETMVDAATKFVW
jgi:hypothetical protein